MFSPLWETERDASQEERQQTSRESLGKNKEDIKLCEDKKTGVSDTCPPAQCEGHRVEETEEGHEQREDTKENEAKWKTRPALQQTSLKLGYVATRQDGYKKSAPISFPVPVGGVGIKCLGQ